MQRLYPTTAGYREPLQIYDDLNFPAGRDGRPYTVLNMVSTVDGKATLDENRERKPIGSPVDRELMKRLRLAVDGVVRGASTVRAGRYHPGVPSELEHLRFDRGLERQPVGIAITASGNLPVDAPFFHEPPKQPIVIATEQTAPDKLDALRPVSRVETIGRDKVDLAAAFALLADKYGLKRLLLEGGPRLNYDCFAAGLVDEIFWTVAPRLGGKSVDLTMIEGPELLPNTTGLTLVSVYSHESELYLRYKL